MLPSIPENILTTKLPNNKTTKNIGIARTARITISNFLSFILKVFHLTLSMSFLIPNSRVVFEWN